MNLLLCKDNKMIKSKRRMLRELTSKEVQIKQDKPRLLRSKSVRVWYWGVRISGTKNYLTLYFKALDFKGTGRKHLCRIVLQDYPDYLVKFSNLKPEEIIRKALIEGQVKVHCTCEDFLYKGFAYMGHAKGYGIVPEKRFPSIRNPQLKGSVCKHCSAVMNRANLFIKSYVLDIEKKNFKQSVRIKTGKMVYII